MTRTSADRPARSEDQDGRPALPLSCRRILAGALALPFAQHVGAATSELVASADAMDLVTLPSKKALIRRSFRPPNLETPMQDLQYALTPNQSLFVRYHLPVIPQVPTRTWRLRIAGAPVMTPSRWETTIRKMIDKMGAPIDAAKAEEIRKYLSTQYAQALE